MFYSVNDTGDSEKKSEFSQQESNWLWPNGEGEGGERGGKEKEEGAGKWEGEMAWLKTKNILKFVSHVLPLFPW